MRYQVSRIIVQRLCDDREDLVPYLTRIIDSLERHGGLYQTKLAEVVPVDVIEELEDWLNGYRGGDKPDEAVRGYLNKGLAASLDMLERTFGGGVPESVK